MQRPAERPRWTTIFITLGLVLAVEIAARDEPFLDRLGADCLGALAVAFIVKYLQERPQRVPLLEYSLLNMCIFWGLPATGLSATSDFKAPASAKTVAVWLCVLAAVAISAGFVLSGRIGGKRKQGVTSFEPWDLPRVSPPILLAWVCLASVLATGKALSLPASTRQMATFVGSQWPLLTYLAMHAVRSGSTRTLWASVGVLSAAGALAGYVGNTVMPIVGTVFLLWYLGKPLPLGAILAVVGLIFILQPAKGIYRQEVWDREDRLSKEDPISGLQRWAGALERSWLNNERRDANMDSTLERFDELTVISVAVASCPGIVPRENGRIWLEVAELMVPRFLWPSKPSLTDVTNNRFQVTFGLQTVEQSRTTTGAFPLPADGWWNFGWLGVAVPGLCIGMLFGWLSRAIGTRTWTRLTLSMVLMMQGNLHAEIATTLTAWVALLLATTVVCWTVIVVRDRELIPERQGLDGFRN